MKSSSSVSSTVTKSSRSKSGPPKIPRLESLEHQLRRAKDSRGKLIPLFDELFFLLDDPPEGTTDRWQKGAELCAEHGIRTSRMSVWRLYRSQVLEWRRGQSPVTSTVDAAEVTLLHEQASLLAAQRALEMLNDPRLSPGHLIGLLQNENHRRKVQLSRDQFNDQIALRIGLCQQKVYQHIEDEIRDRLRHQTVMENIKRFFPDPKPPKPEDVTPHNTP